MPKDAPGELDALLDVHLLLLQDEALAAAIKHWISERLYNAEWALTTQLEIVSRQFDEMEDEYLRERKADLEQVVERILRHMKGMASPFPLLPRQLASRVMARRSSRCCSTARRRRRWSWWRRTFRRWTCCSSRADCSPASSPPWRANVAHGHRGPQHGHSCRRGARAAGQLIRQDDWIIIDGNAGIVIVDPTPIILAEYGFRQRQNELERERLSRLRHTPALTLDGERIELLANIEQPGDGACGRACGAVGVGLFRTEFLFMGRGGNLPGEEEQYRAYREAVDGMQGMPVTIRTLDVGADKPLDKAQPKDYYLNPALGLRAIRWSLADPAMFRTQLRAILRAAAHGQIHLLFPMLAHQSEIEQTLAQVRMAQGELDARGVVYGPVKLGP